MWELYERRLEAEHYLAPEVRANALIDRLICMPAGTSEEAFRAQLGALTYADVRAFFDRVTKLTEGSAGQDGGDAEAGRAQPDRDRLLVLHAVALAVISEAVKTRTDRLAEQDVEPVQACTPIDKQMADAFRAAYQRQATADDVGTLDAAARGYEAIGNRASLSQAGRHVPDADARLGQLLDSLQRTRTPSVGRATVLVDLAQLASGNHDDFEAEQRLDDAVAELAAAGYAVPEPGSTDRAVMRWIEAVPPGDSEEPIPFQRQISALLALHHRAAGIRVTLALRQHGDDGRPGRVAAAELQLNRLTEIINEAPAHDEAVQARLEAQVGGFSPPGFGPGDQPGRAREFTAIMSIIGELRDLTAKSLPDSPETLARWRQMATDVITRARAYGQPVNLAQALGAAASVEEAVGEFNAAVGLLEEAYEQAAHIPGKQAADQAIIALSRMAKIQFVIAGLNDKKAALDTASMAIELIERDRYRVSAPFQQAALLEPHADLFAIGILAAWKIATDDTGPDRTGPATTGCFS